MNDTPLTPEQILEKYVELAEEAIIRPALKDLEEKREAITSELDALSKLPAEIGAEEDREITRNFLQVRLARVDKSIRGLRPQFLGILKLDESMDPDEGAGAA